LVPNPPARASIGAAEQALANLFAGTLTYSAASRAVSMRLGETLMLSVEIAIESSPRFVPPRQPATRELALADIAIRHASESKACPGPRGSVSLERPFSREVRFRRATAAAIMALTLS